MKTNISKIICISCLSLLLMSFISNDEQYNKEKKDDAFIYKSSDKNQIESILFTTQKDIQQNNSRRIVDKIFVNQNNNNFKKNMETTLNPD
jgi:hypothetical protein